VFGSEFLKSPPKGRLARATLELETVVRVGSPPHNVSVLKLTSFVGLPLCGYTCDRKACSRRIRNH